MTTRTKQATSIRSKTGRPVAAAGASIDIAERKRTDEEDWENEGTIHGLLEQSLVGVFIADGAGRLAYVNPRFAQVIGYEIATDFIGKPLIDFISDADRAAVREAMSGLLSGKVATVEIAATILQKQGAAIDVIAQGSLSTFHGKSAIVGVVVDVTERKKIQERLQFANALFTAQLEGSPDGILVADQNRRIVLFNHRFGEMWRIPQSVVAEGSDDVVLRAGTLQLKDPQGFYDRVIRLYDHPEEIGDEDIDFKDGRVFHRYSASLYDAARKHLGRVWFFRDITAQKQAEAELRHTSRHDGLTGLANRRVFMERVQQEIAWAERGGKTFAVLFLDLDHFKDVNDTLGHPTGDDLLCAVADRLRSSARETDLVARFGGDEFAVIATAVGKPADAANIADKFVAAIGDSFSIQGNDIQSGISIGIAVYEPGDPNPETLLAHADVALYRAKADGGAEYRFFTNAMDAEVRTRVRMSAELREAIASGQLFLHYQPQVEAQTGRIIGVEALVRWNHPRRGVLSPGEFIQVAETAGLSVALDRWVKREACGQGRDWLDADIEPVVISVNVSGAQFKRPIELENDVALVLELSGLPPHLLELELTETVLMEASHDHNEVLARLRKRGVRLAIDDFGTGYSSLDYLRRYPADRVKIAQDFVRQIAFDPGSAAIVRATIALTRELGMVAIAEGVETREQFELLKAWGCTQVQGFYFAKPLAPEDILPLLLRGRILEPTATFGKTAA